MASESEEKPGLIRQAGAFLLAPFVGALKSDEVHAAFRQGVAEIGTALKAFPDSIQIDEPGAVWNPLYSELAQNSRERNPSPAAPLQASLPSPSAIAASPAAGSVHGESPSVDKQALPSPSAIANAPMEPNSQEHGQQHGQEQARELGRAR